MLSFIKSVIDTQQKMDEEFEKTHLANSEKRKLHAAKMTETEKHFNLQSERIRNRLSFVANRSK